jgi:hypothetical protein
MEFLAIAYMLVFLWTAVPTGVLVGFTVVYGYHCQCETELTIGLPVTPKIKFGVDYLYWAPVGIVALEVTMLPGG